LRLWHIECDPVCGCNFLRVGVRFVFGKFACKFYDNADLKAI